MKFKDMETRIDCFSDNKKIGFISFGSNHDHVFYSSEDCQLSAIDLKDLMLMLNKLNAHL